MGMSMFCGGGSDAESKSKERGDIITMHTYPHLL